MPYRVTPLVTEEYYHVYNRGIASQPTFFSKSDYERFYYAYLITAFLMFHLGYQSYCR